MPRLKHFTAAAAVLLACLSGTTARAQALHSVELNYVGDIPHVRLRGVWPVYSENIAATASFEAGTVWIRVTGSNGGFSVVMPWELNVRLPPSGGRLVAIEVAYYGLRLGGLRPYIDDPRPVEEIFWNGFEG